MRMPCTSPIGITYTELPGLPRRVYAVTYGDPPDPRTITALLAALVEAPAPA
jgi:hypothetical protein